MVCRRSRQPARPPLTHGLVADVVVVGAGIAGLTAADALSRAGLDVRVLENRQIGSGATGFTTAKISRLHGVIHHDLTKRHDAATAKAYATANQLGFEHLLARLTDLGLDDIVERRDAISFVTDPANAHLITGRRRHGRRCAGDHR